MPEVDRAPAGAPEPRPAPRWPWNVRHVVVEDESMRPALRPGDRLLVDRTAYRNQEPRVGDIVVLRDPERPGRWLVKRVATVGPGEYRTRRTGPRPPAPSEAGEPVPSGDPGESVPLPAGSVYVVGDAPESRDSHQFGPVGREALVGRAYRCYAPPDRRRRL